MNKHSITYERISLAKSPEKSFSTATGVYTHPMKEDVKEKILPSPRGGDVGVVTYIQPRLLVRRAFGFAALHGRVIQRRCQPQLLVPTWRFHEAVVA